MTKDVMRITGKNRRQSQTIISSIKKELNEKRQQPVTIGEFRQHHYIDRQELPPPDQIRHTPPAIPHLPPPSTGSVSPC
ncbi:MAG: hypothetical protein H6568_09125 [Lewinellaceae bacterium]|nr:hypothetical protein [Lewinellaceae bacterium]HRW74313.1 hypothetical protein [Saprospiraceae bacterium]